MALGLQYLTPEQRMEIGAELKNKPKEELAKFLQELTPEEREELLYDEYVWLREKQYVPINLEQNISLILAGRGFGKLVSKDTEILTTEGWKTVGEIQIGDKVFDERGIPCNVTNYFESEPESVYDITFDTGEVVTACGDHLWTTWTRANRKAYSRESQVENYPEDWWCWKYNSKDKWVNFLKHHEVTTKTTKEIVDTFTQGVRKDLNHSIPLTKPLEFAEKDVSLHPYVMGVWLGDGTSTNECVTGIDEDIWPNVEKFGYEVKSDYKCDILARIMDIKDSLIKEGVFKNKNIPENYLLNSASNRLLLLQGLMDTNGHISNKNGVAEFCQKDESIAKGVFELACSLGAKAYLYTVRSTLNGVDYGEKFRVCWRVSAFNPFLLPRKKDIADIWLNKNSSQKLRTRHRMLKSFKQVDKPSCGMRCLEVDSPSRLFLITRSFIATHNTFTGSKWTRQAVEIHGAKRLMLSAPTLGDIKKVMLDGESGLMAMYPDTHPNKPVYYPSYGVVRWPVTKSEAILVPYESMERARGPQQSHVWIDEPASMGSGALEFVENILMGTRLYPAQILITGTPKPTPLMLNLVEREGKDVRIVRGSTYENEDNLDERMIRRAKMMENTPMGRQEIYAELALTNPAALWSPDLIESSMVVEKMYPPKMWTKVAIGIDPSANKTKSDLTGICVAVQITDGTVVVWRDCSGTYTSEGWTKLVADLYDEFGAYAPTVVVIEQNGVGATWQDILNKHRNDIPVKQFQTTKNKYSRIGQTSYMFEVGKVKMNKDSDFQEMQREMQTYTGGPKEKSPDHVEAMCFAVNELLYKKQNVTISREILF